jgi:3-isopropylmalate/(R)-2-methylmalate dehydratase small subunit
MSPTHKHSQFAPLTELTAQVAVLPEANTDTDQIIPARFLKKDRAQGYGQFLFHDARFDADGQPLSHPLNSGPAPTHAQSAQTAKTTKTTKTTQRPQILVVGENFGCGSSREGAVYALVDYGIRAVVGTTFGDIFHNNCFKNGVLPVRLAPSDHAKLTADIASADKVQSALTLTIDLQAQEIRWQQQSASFAVDAFWRECLLKGLDELSLTLSYQADIDRFEADYQARYPWLSNREIG